MKVRNLARAKHRGCLVMACCVEEEVEAGRQEKVAGVILSQLAGHLQEEEPLTTELSTWSSTMSRRENIDRDPNQ